MRLRQNRAFVLLALAHATRGMGFWLYWIGMLSFASFRLNASAGSIAVIVASTSVPYIVLAPFSGTIVDRTNPKWTLAACFAGGSAVALWVANAHATWQLTAGAIASATAGTLVWPALGALIKKLAPDEDLRRANGVLGSLWEVTLIAGPALAGLLAATIGPRSPMVAGSAMFAAGCLIVMLMPYRRERQAAVERITASELREGIVTMFALRDLRVFAIWGSIAWSAFSVLIAVEPVFVREILGGGSARLGLLYSIGGIGSTTGALAVGWLRFARRELIVASIGLAMVGGFFALYIGIGRWPAVAPIQAFIGAGFATYMTLSQALVQRRSPERSVGRVIAAKRGLEETMGLAGALAGGAVAQAAGVRPTLIGAGMLMVAAAGVMVVRGRTLERAEAAAIPQQTAGDPLHDLVAAPLAGPEEAPGRAG